MSLIADALKRAQEQRTGSVGDDDKARRMLSAPGPLRVESPDGGMMTRPLALAVAAAVVGALVLVGAIILAPSTTTGASAWAGQARARAVDPGPAAVLNGSDLDDVAERGSGLALEERASGTADDPGRGQGGARGQVGEGPGPGGGGLARSGRAPEPMGRPAGAGPAGEDRTTAGTPPTETEGAETERAETASRADGGSVDRRPGGRDAAGVRGERSSFQIDMVGASGERTAEQYMEAALEAHRSGDLAGAVGLYRSALEVRPDDATLWNNLGTAYRGLGDVDEALSALRSAVAADPSYAPAWSNLGLVLDSEGRDGEAIEAYREALRRDPTNIGAKVNLANKYQAMGMRDEARALLQGALRDDPALPEAHYALARVEEEEGNVSEAIRHYRLFLELGRGRFPALETRVHARIAALLEEGS